MPHRIVHVLLVVALASSGVSAPFMHVHAHGASSSHGEAIDDHCAHHHAEGAHWHAPGSPVPDTAGAPAADGPGHRHAAVALSVSGIETSASHPGPSFVRADAPETGVPSGPTGARAPVAADSGPDPPPRSVNPARAPPVRS